MKKEKLALETYDVDETGRVWNKVTGNEISQRPSWNGYMLVFIKAGDKKSCIRVHRLVAVKYLSNKRGYTQVCHRDFNKRNNHVFNLEWGTQRIILDHALRHGRLSYFGEMNPNSVMLKEEVLDTRKRIHKGETFKTIYADYSDRIGWYSFRSICRGRAWRHLL